MVSSNFLAKRSEQTIIFHFCPDLAHSFDAQIRIASFNEGVRVLLARAWRCMQWYTWTWGARRFTDSVNLLALPSIAGAPSVRLETQIVEWNVALLDEIFDDVHDVDGFTCGFKLHAEENSSSDFFTHSEQMLSIDCNLAGLFFKSSIVWVRIDAMNSSIRCLMILFDSGISIELDKQTSRSGVFKLRRHHYRTR